MKHICIFLIRLYQKLLSPLKRTPTCRFCPTCSAFAIEAFQKRGFFAGMLLTFFRILRCNPFCPGGYDPVPEHGITIRSYYVSRVGKRELLNHEEQDNCTEDALPAESTNAPAAGGNESDRGEQAADENTAPIRACVRYQPKR